MGLPPGSQAIWGSVPIIFSSSDESDKVGDLLFRHDPLLEAQVLLLSARSQIESDHKLHVEHVDSLDNENN